MKACEVRVSGRVQGVYFRVSARTQARRLGLSGWVKNLSDGGVALFLQHEEQGPIDEMLAWCSVGPRGADVSAVEAEETEPDRSLDGFEVR
jgi:acylphosphatase